MLQTEIKDAYIRILREELVPATGCTEPIAIAYAAARLRAILGCEPERIRAEVSGNIIKNVKSVVLMLLSRGIVRFPFKTKQKGKAWALSFRFCSYNFLKMIPSAAREKYYLLTKS